MNNEEWTEEELARLRAARTDAVPPPGLEDATVAALQHRGLVASAFRRRTARRLAAAGALLGTAAALVAAIAWSVTHKPAPPAGPPAAPRFVLLLYAGAEPIAGAADTRRREYAQWARGVAAGGAAISGEELSEDGREVPAPVDAPPAMVPLPRGFFVVSAPDLDAAQRIASTCPHLRYGGRIVVKRIVS
jgi:hypothetical protein